MIWPIIGAMVGAGGSIAGSLIGADAQEDTNRMNWAINVMNYQQRERERAERLAESREIRRKQEQGGIDGQGNRTRFIDGKGWVTELSGSQKTLSDLQQAEQLNVLSKDLPMRRKQLQTNAARQSEEADVARNLLKSFRSMRREDPAEIEAQMRVAASVANNGQYDELTNSAMRKAIRTGSSNTGKIIDDLAKSRRRELSNVMANLPLQARQVADQRDNAKQQQYANLYNMFATRAGAMPGVSYAPQNVSGGSNQLLQFFAQQGQQGNEAMMTAHKTPGGTLDYIQPNLGYAQAVSGGAQAIGAVFDKIGSYSAKQDQIAEASRIASGTLGF